MSGGHVERVFRHTLREVVRECAARGHEVTDALATFTVTAVILDPTNGFNADRTLTQQDFRKLEELCVEQLMEKCSTSLDTIKMQLCFKTSYSPGRGFVEEVRRASGSRLTALSREITDSRVKSREEMDALYLKIITYIQLRSGMGSPTDATAVHQAQAALQSVFPQTGLGAFMGLLKRHKEEKLDDLTTLVTGIQLFTKASETGGEDTDLHELMPAVLNEALPVVSKSIGDALSASQTLAWKYSGVVERLTEPSRPPGEPVNLLRTALYNVRQHQAFLQALLADACSCGRRVETLQTELLSQMQLLKGTVRSRKSIRTAEVFPLFKSLSKLWSGLQDEAELLNNLKNTMNNLQPFVASQRFSEAQLDALLEGSEVKTDEQRIIESSDERIDPAETETRDWLLPETTAGFNELPLEYNGVCGYTLVSRDGLLLPGNPNIGLLKHKEKLYAFRSKEAALKFASSPDDFVAEVTERARRCPELVGLLKLQQQHSCVSPHSEMQPGESAAVKPITRCDGGTQTDLHPVEPNIDRSYEWNEWELRRNAIRLADLRTKVTRSAQTHLSHMRRENATQTWLPKVAACQTTRTRDHESNVRPYQIHLAGLMEPRHEVHTNLTRSVIE